MPLHAPGELPPPSPEAKALSDVLAAQIRAEIEASGGWISFARYMTLALYAPGLGYYSAGSAKLGPSGDFVTAPELSPLFAQCLARQLADILEAAPGDVLELGAGSGALAADLLAALAALGRAPERYAILEVSAELRERQRALIEQRAGVLARRVQWLEDIPDAFSGAVVANEVLDAVPTHLVRVEGGTIEEIGVTVAAEVFALAPKPAAGELLEAARALALPDGYTTEINLASRALTTRLARALDRGAIVLIDYGFGAAEYYHPQRSSGTLMCHYRHRAHGDALALPGLQDITAHVDFTSIAAAGADAGLQVLGYASQAQFLVNTGITELLAETPASDARVYAPLAAQAQTLLSPAEMGELFKVLALGRGVPLPLRGFARGDRTHTL